MLSAQKLKRQKKTKRTGKSQLLDDVILPTLCFLIVDGGKLHTLTHLKSIVISKY
jgi:hypothetical protein